MKGINRLRSIKLRQTASGIITPFVLAGTFLLICVGFLLVINYNSKTEQSKDIQILGERIAKNIELRLKGNLDFINLIAIERADGNIDEKKFHAHVKQFLSDHPEFINITWIDSNFVIRTVSPLEGNSHIIGLRIELPEPRRASRLAKEKKESVYTRPFEAIQSSASIEVWVPVYNKEKFMGLFAGVYSCEQLLRLAIPSDKQYLSFFSLIDENENVLAQYPKTNFDKADISYHASLPSLKNGVMIDAEMVKKQPFNWILRLLTFLSLALIIGFSYSLWKIKTEMNARIKIQDILKKNQAELKKQNEEYYALNEELKKSNSRIQNINQELLDAKENAEESDRLKTAFLQNMSHEIRTPMNAIMGFSGLLKEQYNDPQKIQRFSEIIDQRCSDLLDIINDILDIAKIESGQVSVNPEPCRLNELFSELSDFFNEYRERTGKQHISLNLQTHCSPDENVIITDKVKLRQIFINLISNAFKFTQKGRVEGGCYMDENKKITFYVSDTGVGIPPDKQKAVFERFVQIKQNTQNQIGGTGLGLPIVKGLVTLLGGEITLSSEPEKGSIFSFTIDTKIVSESDHTKVSPAPVKLKNSGFKNILIVEDDFYNAQYLREILSGNELKLWSALSGEDAIAMIEKQPIDLILMDIRLPGIDGYETIRQIRSIRPDMKIIVQTAYASTDEKYRAKEAGCNDYISKPVRKDLLLSKINNCMQDDSLV